jgi:exosome complex component RRP45
MLRTHLDNIAHSTKFIKDALSHNIRLDGRQALECREVELNLDRDEYSSRCEVIMGRTRALSKVRCDVVTPYADRPSEGMIQFNASLSLAAEGGLFSNVDIVRALEKSIRESDAIDTESLCIISGERVWLISCEIVVLDYDGNLIDASILAGRSPLSFSLLFLSYASLLLLQSFH